MSGPVNSVDLMAKAIRACTSARVLLDVNDADGACNRAYYAMFDAARAALILKSTALNRDSGKTHGGLLNAFSNEFVKNGLVSKEIGKSLKRAEGIRLAADYKGESIPMGDAEVIVADAELFVAEIKTILGTDATATDHDSDPIS